VDRGSAPQIRAPRVGATDQGAEPGATSAATSCHAGSAASHLGTKIHGAETCYLGAARHGAELRVHFPNSFQQGSNCEILRKRAKKKQKKKSGRRRCGKAGREEQTCRPRAVWQLARGNKQQTRQLAARGREILGVRARRGFCTRGVRKRIAFACLEQENGHRARRVRVKRVATPSRALSEIFHTAVEESFS
jgi:hypothetical protein